jgi:uncharacterized glyoxalase superfamily protein PhnB
MEIKTEIILYVADQKRSADFYRAVLQKEPTLDVPGMTEFQLSQDTLLGLMPEKGISKLLTGMRDPAEGNGIPRCELYLFHEDPSAAFHNAVKAGAFSISDAQPRDWGYTVSYCADPDGHVIAFAKRS